MAKIIIFLGSLYPYVKKISVVIGAILTYGVLYRKVYFIIGMFFTRKFKPAKNKHKYGIVISARNEEKVIGNLLDSINKQDYPKELYQVFVVADNCTDKTAEIARKKGAIVYERFDLEHKTKGYALEYLFDRIEEDYKRNSYEGYFVFDADNLLEKNFISKMNDAFDSGEKIITSYRNIKNIDENWITIMFGVHWLRSIRENHRARSVLRLATNIQGTGYLFASEVVENGWHYTSLTEDRGFTADAVSQGYRIAYQNDAIFYDEQTPNFKVAYNQKLRWSKGLLINFKESGLKLFANIFCGKKFVKVKWSHEEKKYPWWKKVLVSLKERFMMYDTFMHLLPTNVINIIKWITASLLFYACYSYSHGITNVNLFSGGTYLAKGLRHLFVINISSTPGMNAFLTAIWLTIWLRIFYRIGAYIEKIGIYYYVLFMERKRIKKIPLKKICLWSLTWPIFDIVGRYTTYIALFKDVGWKPVPHESKVTIDDLNKESK